MSLIIIIKLTIKIITETRKTRMESTQITQQQTIIIADSVIANRELGTKKITSEKKNRTPSYTKMPGIINFAKDPETG